MPFTPTEIITYFRLGWGGLSGAWRFFRRNKRTLTPQEKLELRAKWKPLFKDYIAKNHIEKLRSDVIVRDVRRLDSYPDIKETRGISPWFRVSLVDTYDRGILLGLRWEELIEERDGFRYAGAKGSGGIKVLLTGFVPYENVETVDWDGDSYYNYPHIYCYFDHRGEPYERVMFCTRGESNGWPYYTELVDAKSVRKLSKKLGINR
jgi:hypothetical protein